MTYKPKGRLGVMTLMLSMSLIYMCLAVLSIFSPGRATLIALAMLQVAADDDCPPLLHP